MPTYLYSDATLEQAQAYLASLCKESHKAWGVFKNTIVLAEYSIVLDGTDWNVEETSILGGVSFSTT